MIGYKEAATLRVCSRSREPLYYYFQVTLFMGHRPPWLSYQLLRQQVVKREGKFKLPKWPNLDIWSTRREPNSKWPPTASYSYNGPPFLIMSRLTYPNDLPMTSNSLLFGCLFYVPSFLIWVVLVWSKTGEPNASFQERGNPFPLSLRRLNLKLPHSWSDS